MSADTSLAAFRALAGRWHLDDEQAAELLGVSPEVLQSSTDDAALGEDALTRIRELTAIARALNTLFSRQLGDQWMTQPNAAAPYNGEWPLDLLVAGGLPAIRQMREALEAQM